MNHIVKKAGKRLYMLRVLKRSNADTSTLLTVYSTIIRPVLEYACEVWHCNITEYLSDDIEKIQKRALRIVLPTASYQEARQFTGIPLLKERRQTLCQRFFAKNAQGPKMEELLPTKLEHDYNKRKRSDYRVYRKNAIQFLCLIISKVLKLIGQFWTCFKQYSYLFRTSCNSYFYCK